MAGFHQGDDKPVLGWGEGGPRMGRNWKDEQIEFDRRGRLHEMVPRWQSNAYGSRNPVAFLIGTSGWGIYMPVPWVQVDLRDSNTGYFIPWEPPVLASDSCIKGGIDGQVGGVGGGPPWIRLFGL
jgi:alpha-glucosidase/alpha-D-xyloside xylohydrolase